MPEAVKPNKEIETAAKNFAADLFEVSKLHDRLISLLSYYGRSPKFDRNIPELVNRQREIMFNLRTAFAEAYPILDEKSQTAAGRFIREATAQLRDQPKPPGQEPGLGLAPVVIVGGVIISAIAAGALVAFHRLISVQKKEIDLQEKLIPLVKAGDLPPDVLQRQAGLFGGLNNYFKLAVLAAAAYFLWPVLKDAFNAR
jgi:hypothetical protein